MKTTKDCIVQSLSCVGPFATPMDCSMQDSLPFTISLSQTHVHWVNYAIQSSHYLLPSCTPALNLSQHQGLFQWIVSSRQVAKILGLYFCHQSFQWYSGLISLLSKGLSRVFSSITIWKYKFFKARPSLWSDSHIHTWLLEDHSFDCMDFCPQSDVSAF